MSLIDRFARRHTYLRISLTDRCNLRCTYCMPEHGTVFAPSPSLLTADEVVRLAAIFVRRGVAKIRLTGGEPLIRRDLEAITARLSALSGLKTIGLTTNGISLDRRAAALRRAGLSTVTISLDTLRPDRFRAIAKRDRLDDVLAGIDAAERAGFDSVKLNMVVMAGVNDDEVPDFVALTRDRDIQVRFIEYMPFPETGWTGADLLGWRTLKGRIEATHTLVPLPGDAGDVGKDFAVEGHRGHIGFVTSMTESFCSSCTRLRLTADGQLKTCLFYRPEIDLLGPLRAGASDTVIEALLDEGMLQKPEAHPPLDTLWREENRAMVQIGG